MKFVLYEGKSFGYFLICAELNDNSLNLRSIKSSQKIPTIMAIFRLQFYRMSLI